MADVPDDAAAQRTKAIATLAVGLVAMLGAYLVDRHLPRGEWLSMVLTAILILVTAVCIGLSWLLSRAFSRPPGQK